MSKLTDREIMIHQIRTFGELVEETGIEPGPDNWHIIAYMIALKHAKQMTPPAPAHRPNAPEDEVVCKRIGALADVAHYIHLHKSSLKEAVEHSLIEMGSFKGYKKEHREFWDGFMAFPDVAKMAATEPRRPRNTRAFKLKEDN